MKPYSMDLREKVLAAVDRGEFAASVGRRFEIHERTVRQFVRRREAGRLEPDTPGPQGPIKLTRAGHQKAGGPNRGATTRRHSSFYRFSRPLRRSRAS